MRRIKKDSQPVDKPDKPATADSNENDDQQAKQTEKALRAPSKISDSRKFQK